MEEEEKKSSPGGNLDGWQYFEYLHLVIMFKMLCTVVRHSVVATGGTAISQREGRVFESGPRTSQVLSGFSNFSP